MTADEVRRMEALYVAGAGIPALAAAFGADVGEVRHLLTRAGVALRPPECDIARAQGKPIPPGVRRRMLREGWTPAELATIERAPLEVERPKRPHTPKPSALGPFPDFRAQMLANMPRFDTIDPTATAVAVARDADAVTALADAFPPKQALFATTTTTTTTTTTSGPKTVDEVVELATWLSWPRISERLGRKIEAKFRVSMAAMSWGNQRVHHPFANSPKRAWRAWRQEVMAAQRKVGLRMADIAARWAVDISTVRRQVKRHRRMNAIVSKRKGFSSWGLDNCEELEQDIPRNLIGRNWK